MITAITGTMLSGKTEKLISLINKESYRDEKVFVIRPSTDDRTEELISHGNIKLNKKDNICVYKTNSLTDLLFDLEQKADLKISNPIFVDEFQFFHEIDADYLIACSKKGFNIFAAGLTLDSRGRDFGAMPYLLARADEIQLLKAYCALCKTREATRTYRLTNTGNQIMVGGKDNYEARCIQCWSPQ